MNRLSFQITLLIVFMLFGLSCSDETPTHQLSRNTWDVDLNQPWRPTNPTNTDFNEMFIHFWKINKTFKSSRTAYGKGLNVRHIRLPRYPKPDNKVVNHVHKWRIAYRSDREFQEKESNAIEKLDSLARIGLLVKTNDTIPLDGNSVAVFTYTFSNMGWKYLRHSRNPFQFSYGADRVLGIERVEQRYTDEQVGLEMYAVTAKIGVAGVEDLEPWARDPQIRKIFPNIGRSLKGKTETNHFIRGARGWTDFRRLRNYSSHRGKPIIVPAPEHYPKDTKKNYKMLQDLEKKRKSLPPPTEEELKALIKKKVENWSNTLPLPGDSKLPVDSIIGPGYKVVVLENKARKTRKAKRIVEKTLPYLKKLVDAGIMIRETVKGWDDPTDPAPDELIAGIYSFSPDLQIPAGPGPRLNFGKFHLSELVDFATYQDEFTGGIRFRYKYFGKLNIPPTWANNPKLLNAWEDLRNAIKIGIAGDGDFGFNRETRDSHAGSGSTWWAFQTAADDPR